MFACMSLNADWAREHIKLYLAVAPVARVGNADGKYLKPASESSFMLGLVE